QSECAYCKQELAHGLTLALLIIGGTHLSRSDPVLRFVRSRQRFVRWSQASGVSHLKSVPYQNREPPSSTNHYGSIGWEALPRHGQWSAKQRQESIKQLQRIKVLVSF